MTVLTPDVDFVLRRRIDFRRQMGYERVSVTLPELTALLDAADERDRLAEAEDRLSVLLWRLTNACVCDAAALSARPGTERDMCQHRQEQTR